MPYPRKITNKRMQNITIALPEIYVENIEKLQGLGLIPSRSEGIRLAVRRFLLKEMNTCRVLDHPLGGEPH